MAFLYKNKRSGRFAVIFDSPVDGGRRRLVRLPMKNREAAAEVAVHVRHLVSAALAKSAVPSATAAWVASVSPALRKRLEKLGLVSPAKPVVQEAGPLLGPYLDGYLASRTDLKPATRIILTHTMKNLTDFFGAGRPLREITEGDGDEWRRYLAGLKLAESTIRRRCGFAKMFLRAAKRKHLIPANPFEELKAGTAVNPERQFFIDRATADKVLAACPDAEWRLIFALCRFAGLRCPTEILLLTWADVHWTAKDEEDTITVHSPKTEHFPGKGSREIPLFPELRPYLQAVYESAAAGSEYVITRYRRSNANLRTQFCRILRKAGIEPWPKIFTNLRSSRETELRDTFPVHVACAWIGNTERVATRHYLQVTDEHFRQAARATPEVALKAALAIGCGHLQALAVEPGQEGKTAFASTGQRVTVGASDISTSMVVRGGFEPPKAEPADLQSAPFDRSGT